MLKNHFMLLVSIGRQYLSSYAILTIPVANGVRLSTSTAISTIVPNNRSSNPYALRAENTDGFR